METIEFTQSLRQIADFYDKHPEVPLPDAFRFAIYTVDEPEDIAPIAKAFGSSFKSYDDNYFKLTKRFGVIDLQVVALRDKVCTKRVVGTKKVIVKTPVVNDLPISYIEKEVEQEIVEWDCGDSILQATKPQEGTLVESKV